MSFALRCRARPPKVPHKPRRPSRWTASSRSTLTAGSPSTPATSMSAPESHGVSPDRRRRARHSGRTLHRGRRRHRGLARSRRTGGSSGIPRGGADIRLAAATARQALLDMAAQATQPSRLRTDYRRRRSSPVSGGQGIPSPVDRRQTLLPQGQSQRRAARTRPLHGGRQADPPLGRALKCTGRNVYLQDFVLPGMLHGRVVRPPAIGAQLLTVDESSLRAIPGVRVVRIGNFLGVVAKDEWAAVRAASELKATWSESPVSPATGGLDTAIARRRRGHDQTSSIAAMPPRPSLERRNACPRHTTGPFKATLRSPLRAPSPT